MKRTIILLFVCCCLCSIALAQNAASPYLFVWAGDAGRKNPDFLSVVSADPAAPDYGRIVATVPVASTANMPHHTEYEFPADNELFASGWATGTVYVFDLNRPKQPRLATQFKGRDGSIYPHSFVRLANGNVVATFQSKGTGYAPPGAVVVMDNTGKVLRTANSATSAIATEYNWPYSLLVDEKLDRVLVTSTPMGMPEWANFPPGSWTKKKIDDQMTWHLQVYRLSDLKLLSSFALPDDAGHHNMLPAEPRLLPDGSQYVNTFSCGLYRMHDLATGHPSAKLVYTFPGAMDMDSMCAVPVVVGKYWIQTVAALPGLIALDISNPDKPVEVSRLKFDAQFKMPHWIAADRKGDRLVITGNEGSWVLVARINQQSGALSLDDSFREPGAQSPGLSFDRPSWPHGDYGKAIVHGALFGPR